MLAQPPSNVAVCWAAQAHVQATQHAKTVKGAQGTQRMQRKLASTVDAGRGVVWGQVWWSGVREEGKTASKWDIATRT